MRPLVLRLTQAGTTLPKTEEHDMTVSRPLVRSETRGAVAWLTIDSAATRNALSGAVLCDLTTSLKVALRSPDIRAIVVTGAGRVFSAGADLRDKTDLASIEQMYRSLFDGITRASKPVIARINGPCFGGAIGLVAICDLSIAVDDARFGFTEVRLGRTATLASVVALPRLRICDAAELVLRGTRFSGARAAEIGLINAAVPSDRLDSELDLIITDLLAGAPRALANSKLLMRLIREVSRDEAWRLAFGITRDTAGSAEALEGASAFFEKRPPVWPPS
jgi:methylglutaconyl-CoA hydratase